MGMPQLCMQHIPLNRKPFQTGFVRCGNLALRSMRTVQFPSKTVMERVMGMPQLCMQHIPLNRKPFQTGFVRCGNLALRSMRTVQFPSKTVMERVMGIGPTQSAWKADILPLNYTRTDSNCTFLEQSTIQCLTILPHRRIYVNKI